MIAAPEPLSAEQIEHERESYKNGYGVNDAAFYAICDLALQALRSRPAGEPVAWAVRGQMAWIPVSERLPAAVYGGEGQPPTDSEDVAVKFEAGDSIYDIATYQHDMKRWLLPNKNYDEPDAEPIAWMLLPK